jgi:hypothetical protein
MRIHTYIHRCIRIHSHSITNSPYTSHKTITSHIHIHIHIHQIHTHTHTHTQDFAITLACTIRLPIMLATQLHSTSTSTSTSDSDSGSQLLFSLSIFRSLRLVHVVTWVHVLIPSQPLRALHSLGGGRTIALALMISSFSVALAALVGLELFWQPEGDFANFAVAFQVPYTYAYVYM